MKRNRTVVLISAVMLFAAIPLFAKMVNWIVAGVGFYSVTDFDIRRMLEFQKASGDAEATEKSAFRNLLISYGLLTLAAQDQIIDVNNAEIEEYIASITNITNAADPSMQFRLKLYQQFPELFKLQVQREQVARALIFYNEELKSQASAEVPLSAISNFYKENKEQLLEPPMLDIIVFACTAPQNSTLDDLANFEAALKKIAERLAWSDDADYILDKYRWMKFTSYSGRTGLKPAYDLLQAGYPEEVLNIPFMDRIPMPTGGDIIVKVGKVITFPQPIPLRATGKPTYLIIKIIAKEDMGPMPFAEAAPMIEMRLRQEMMDNVVENYVLGRLVSGSLFLQFMDSNRQSLYREMTAGVRPVQAPVQPQQG